MTMTTVSVFASLLLFSCGTFIKETNSQNIDAYDVSHFDLTLFNPYIDNGTHEIPVHVSYPSSKDGQQNTTTFPLVIFMHGDPCEWWWYEYLTNYLVSKGYIVALLASEEPRGSPGPMSLDMKYTLDELISISENDKIYNNESNPLYSKINKLQTCAAGHSAGSDASILAGSTSWEYPFVNNFVSIVSLASFNSPDIKTAISNWNKQPILMLSGSDDCICPPSLSKSIYQEFDNTICKYFGEITNGTHCDFAEIYVIGDVCSTLEFAACNAENRDIDEDKILPKDIQLGLTQEYVYKFLQASLIEQTQEGYDSLYTMMKQELSSNGTQNGLITDLEYNCVV